MAVQHCCFLRLRWLVVCRQQRVLTLEFAPDSRLLSPSHPTFFFIFCHLLFLLLIYLVNRFTHFCLYTLKYLCYLLFLNVSYCWQLYFCSGWLVLFVGLFVFDVLCFVFVLVQYCIRFFNMLSFVIWCVLGLSSELDCIVDSSNSFSSILSLALLLNLILFALL